MSLLPLVSIGAINYNNAKYVIDTLNSIKNQTYDNIELIIVDDCSTDNSVELIRNWLINFDKPYKFIVHEKNMGVCATTNDTLKNASGKYFSYIATDDMLMPDKIKIQVDILEKSDESVGAVYSDAYMIKDDGSPSYGWYIQWYRSSFEDVPSGNLYDTLLDEGFMPAMSVLMKMDALKKVGLFDEDLAYEDYDMWLRIAREYKIVFSDYVSAIYRRRAGSLRSTINNWRPSSIKIYLKHLNHPSGLRNLRVFAKKCYMQDDKESAALLEKSAVRNDSFIKLCTNLIKYKVPKFVGVILMNRLFSYSRNFT